MSHGEAVGWGMIAATRLAYRKGIIDDPLSERMERSVRALAPLPEIGGLPVSRIMRAIDKDKKIGSKGIRFVLPVAIGQVQVAEAFPRDDIRWVVRSLGAGRS